MGGNKAITKISRPTFNTRSVPRHSSQHVAIITIVAHLSSPSSSLPLQESEPPVPSVHEFPPSLQSLLRAFYDGGIEAIEWGTGLSQSMGAPVVVMDHFIVVPSDHLDAVLYVLATMDFHSAPTTKSPRGVVDTVSRRFSIPDTPYILHLLDKAQVPLDLARVHLVPERNVWQPAHIEALRSYIYIICRYSQGYNSGPVTGPRMWLSEFVVHAVCGCGDIKKVEYEGQDYDAEEDAALECAGLARIDALPWTAEFAWLKPTLRRLVKGEVRYEEFTREWWEQQTGTTMVLKEMA